jgi:ribose transport system substrate-binding protein
MNVRRGCAAAVAVALAAGLAACGGGSSGDGQASKQKAVRVDVVMASLGNDFYIAQKAGIERQAAADPGVKVSVSAGRTQSATDDVVRLIEDAIARHPDAIAVNGSDDAPLLPALRQVLAAHIPLVLFDASADALDGRLAAYIGTDNRAGGAAGGAWLKQQRASGKLGVILCIQGNPVTTARYDGFRQAAGPGWKVVATADAQCDPEKGRKAMEDMVAAHPDLDAVFSTSDSQSIGAVKALQAAHKDPLFVSFDAQPPVVKDIEAGTVVDASVAWSAREIGADAVKAAVAAARRRSVAKQTLVPVTVVTKDNAAGWKG